MHVFQKLLSVSSRVYLLSSSFKAHNLSPRRVASSLLPGLILCLAMAGASFHAVPIVFFLSSAVFLRVTPGLHAYELLASI